MDAAIQSLPAETRAGFTSIFPDPEAGNVQVYWKGAEPPALRRALEKRGIAERVEGREARFSSAELTVAVRSAVDHTGSARVTVAGGELPTGSIFEAHPLSDGSGISVTLASDQLDSVQARTKVKPSGGVLHAGATDVPVTITTGVQPVKADLRGDFPNRSGAYILVPGTTTITNNATCTAGFVVSYSEVPGG